MGKDASTIRQEIEQIRERMGDTVEALAYKTDVPARVKDNVNDRVDAVRGSIGNVVENVKSAVVGASDSVRSSVSDAGDSLSSAVDNGSRTGSSAFSQARDQVNATVSSAGGAISNATDVIGDRIANVDVAGNARRAVGAVQENPIGLAIAALAIGFLTGSLLPVSDAERERIGPLRDKLVDQAQAAAGDLVQAGKAVAFDTMQSAASAAMNSAQSHGQDVVDAAKTRAQQN